MFFVIRKSKKNEKTVANKATITKINPVSYTHLTLPTNREV